MKEEKRKRKEEPIQTQHSRRMFRRKKEKEGRGVDLVSVYQETKIRGRRGGGEGREN